MFLSAPTLREALAFDFSALGRALFLDHGGARLRVGDLPPLELDEPALAARFLGESPVLLFATSLRSLDEVNGERGRTPVREGASALAVLASGSLLVGYAGAAHGVLFGRIGAAPTDCREPFVEGVRSIAVESGGFWLLGQSEAVRLRPAAEGFRASRRVALPAPPDAACIGPDGALFVACGRVLLRCFDESPDPPHPLNETLRDLARHEGKLFGLQESGVIDLSGAVPSPGPGGPEFNLPSCSA